MTVHCARLLAGDNIHVYNYTLKFAALNKQFSNACTAYACTFIRYDRIRYDTIDYINVRPKADV